MAARVVLDEFTAPAEKAALLERSRGRIEALFGVGLAVLGALGAEEPLPARIWLQLRGAQEAVHSAKVPEMPEISPQAVTVRYIP
ncbi:NEDD4-binding protein 1 [Microtus ochrogaster]|uniref:NEDD4-binding protein 1 n=1 Tax=Microtus ochrogaster TaxID=79684 RepID=A0A8J6KRB3_MICOH|nr:NEDD4-binding protein 1 [Microtus ochrogaster]